jgi:AcrR family transcriptional regulator
MMKKMEPYASFAVRYNLFDGGAGQDYGNRSTFRLRNALASCAGDHAEVTLLEGTENVLAIVQDYRLFSYDVRNYHLPMVNEHARRNGAPALLTSAEMDEATEAIMKRDSSVWFERIAWRIRDLAAADKMDWEELVRLNFLLDAMQKYPEMSLRTRRAAVEKDGKLFELGPERRKQLFDRMTLYQQVLRARELVKFEVNGSVKPQEREAAVKRLDEIITTRGIGFLLANSYLCWDYQNSTNFGLGHLPVLGRFDTRSYEFRKIVMRMVSQLEKFELYHEYLTRKLICNAMLENVPEVAEIVDLAMLMNGPRKMERFGLKIRELAKAENIDWDAMISTFYEAEVEMCKWFGETPGLMISGLMHSPRNEVLFAAMNQVIAEERARHR